MQVNDQRRRSPMCYTINHDLNIASWLHEYYEPAHANQSCTRPNPASRGVMPCRFRRHSSSIGCQSPEFSMEQKSCVDHKRFHMRDHGILVVGLLLRIALLELAHFSGTGIGRRELAFRTTCNRSWLDGSHLRLNPLRVPEEI